MILECPSCQARFKVAENAIPETGRTVRCSRCANQWHVDATASPAEEPAPVVSNARQEALDAIAAARSKSAEPAPDMVEAVPMEETISPAAQAEGEAFMSQLEAAINATEAGVEPSFPRPADARAPRMTARRQRPLDMKPFKIAVPTLAALWLVVALCAYFPKWMNAPVASSIYQAFGAAPTDGLMFADVTMERERGEGGKTRFILAGAIRNNSSAARAVPTIRVSLRDGKGEPIWGRSYLDPKAGELKAGDVYPFKISNVETMFANNVKLIKVDMGNSLQLMAR